MKKILNTFIYCLFGFMISSCSKNESLSSESNSAEGIEPDINFSSNSGNSKYSYFFADTDNSIGFSSLKPDPLTEYSTVENVSSSEVDKQTKISLHNRVLIPSVNTEHVKLNSSISNNIYGHKVNFKIPISNQSTNQFFSSVNGAKNTGSETQAEFEMYVPELIEITSPKNKSSSDLFLPCYYDGFILEWNADEKNGNGLVVIAEYKGMNAIPSNDTDEYIMNIDIIENDNGSTILNTSLFEGIPDLSLVDITLMRGNIDVHEIQGKLHKFYGESHEKLPIVLMRNFDSIEIVQD